MESLHEYTAKSRRQARRESSFGSNLNAKLQGMTLQPSPNKPTNSNSNFSFNSGLKNAEVPTFTKSSPTVPAINIQGSSPGNFSPKATRSVVSRSPSPSRINASLQNSFKFTSNVQRPTANPLPPIASQGYFSAPQSQTYNSAQPPPYYTQHHQQPRGQAQFFPMPHTQLGQQTMAQMPQLSQGPLQFSFPSSTVPVMYQAQPVQYQPTQPMYSHPAQSTQYTAYSVPVQHAMFGPNQYEVQQQYMNFLKANMPVYQPMTHQVYQPHQQLQPLQHAPYQYMAAEQAIHNDLALNSTHPASDHSAEPQFSFPSSKAPNV